MKTINDIMWNIGNIVGFVKIRGKVIPRYYAFKMLMIFNDIELHNEIKNALYGNGKSKDR